MIKKLLFCVLTIVVITAKAQSQYPYVVPNKDWVKQFSHKSTMNGSANALDANSNVYSTGYHGSLGTEDLLCLKYDSTGVQTYSYSYDHSGGKENGTAIKINLIGNAFIAGYSEDTSPGGTGIDYVVFKLSPTGVLLWAQPARFDGAVGGGGGIDEATAISIDANGDVYVTGRSQNSNGNFDIVTIKLNGTNGSLIWKDVFNGGGNLDDEGTGITLSSDGQTVYVTGNTTDPGNGTDIVTFALDASTGTPLWPAVITNGSSNGNDKSHGIILTGANITVCGEIDNSSSGKGMDGVLIKYDGGTGNVIFQKDYDAYLTDDRATSLARDSAGNIGTVGTSINGSIYEYHLVLYDSLGNQYGVNKESTGLTAINVDPTLCNDSIAHHWYVAGEIMNATKDIFVYQVTPTGNTSWRQSIDGQDSDVDAATGVAVNGIGVVYACGLSKNSSADYDYTTIKLNQTPVYWPPDFNGETVNLRHLYLKNQGQLMRTDSVLASEVLYYTHNTTPEVYIEQNAFNFVFRRVDTVSATLDTIERIQHKFLGCNSLANHHEYLPKLTNYNYYLGYALSPQIENVQGNERVFVPNFYPYIDLHYFSCAGGIKYYLVVKPGAHIGEIRMKIEGATSSIDVDDNTLFMDGQLGDVTLGVPIAYTVNWLGQAVPISGSSAWVSFGSGIYGIITPTYNLGMPLIIQVSAITQTVPTVNKANLDYSTYYGGQGNDFFNDIAAAANGDRHITGYTDSPQFPPNNFMFTYKADKDAIVVKYTADDTLRVASFMGGLSEDVGNSIAVNANNDVFVGGYTWSTNFPAKPLLGASNQTVNGRNPSIGDYQDGFLAKFSNDIHLSGQPNLQWDWSRYYGGTGNDAINSVHVDGSGNLYFVGESKSPSIASHTNANQPNNTGPTGSSDAILGKLNTNLSMVFATFFGGSSSPFTTAGRDIGMDIITDNSGKIIICGCTDATNLPVQNSSGNNNTFYKGTISGTNSQDGFLARYSPTGTKDFATYFGGNGIDAITRLTHDPLYDNIYFAGDSRDTTNFPFLYKAGALNSRVKTARTAFVGRMAGDLTKNWCSFYGRGTAFTTTVSGLCIDSYGVLYVSGMTTSDTIHRPLTQPTTVVYKDSIKNSTEGFVAIFNPDQSLYHAHFFGGGSADQINGADISQDQKLYVVGHTGSNDFPIAYSSVNATEIDSTHNGGIDGFISRFDLNKYQITGLSESSFDKTQLSVYPNPTSTGFNLDLKLELPSPVNLKVFNLMGQLIYEQAVKDKMTSVNCESWTNGVYLISVSDAHNQKTFKLIKN